MTPSPRPSPLAPRPIRVMFVIWSLGLGGAEQAVIRLAAGLRREGFEPLICCLNEPGPFAVQAQAAGVPVVALHKRWRYDARVLWRLMRLMRQWHPDVVHTHLWGGNAWGRTAAWLVGVPVIVTSERNLDPWKRWYYFVIDRVLAARTTTLLAVSESVRAFYEQHGVGRGRWQVCYNGVDIADVTPRQRGAVFAQLGAQHGEPVVGFIGRLASAKAPDVFVEAVAQARRTLPSLKALIVGDGPLRSEVEALARRLGLDGHLVVTGVREDIPELLAGMDALMVSSEREGLSMAMLEAMAAGVPVIATRVGGTPELIEPGMTGLLAPPGAPDALARQLVALLTNPAHAQAIRDAARARVAKDFSMQRVVATHAAVYRRGLKQANRAGLSDRVKEAAASLPIAHRARLRVMHVIDDLGLGGAQRQLVELVKAFPRDRYELHVVSLSTTKTDYAEALHAAEIRLTQIPQAGKWDGRCFSTLSTLIKTEKPSIVHTWLFTADLYGRMAAWVAHVPVIISAVRSVEPDKPAHYVVVDRVLRNITSAFTVNARAIGEVLTAREHVPTEKIHTIYNGLDLRALDPSRVNGAIRRAIAVGADVPLIGIVGRLAPVKDHATFLRAAVRVHREAPQARFLIVGNGLLHGELEQLSQSLGLSDVVRFLESQSNVAEVFAALDVVVVSSLYEGCCNVILEAMAMGKPVIATAVGGNPELISDGQTGLLVPVGDDAKLAEAMVSLLRDPQRAQAMGRSGRARVECDFAIERMVVATDRVYQKLLSRAP